MSKRLEGKIAVVTGGCRGIGKSIVERYASEGARVFAFDYVIPDGAFIDNSELAKNVSAIQVDVTKEDSVNAAFEKVVKEAGKIDILVNNAGITRDNIMMRMNVSDWDSVINTNLKGAFLCCKAVARTMMSQRSGRIINMGSIVGTIGNAGQVNYSSSKAGLIGLTKSLAKELGSRNILVNLVAPGFIDTPMTEVLTDEQKQAFLNNIPVRKAGKPEDIANVVCFLSSEDSSYMTGQVLHVDGGLYM